LGTDLSLIQIAIPVVWAAFILWTVHKLWRTPKDPKLNKSHRAAKIYGLCMSISACTILPSIVTFPGVPYWQESLVFGVIAFPVSLWTGYAIERCLQAIGR
jgi:hypothetical protein